MYLSNKGLRELEQRLERARQEAERMKAQIEQLDRGREQREQEENAKQGQQDNAPQIVSIENVVRLRGKFG